MRINIPGLTWREVLRRSTGAVADEVALAPGSGFYFVNVSNRGKMTGWSFKEKQIAPADFSTQEILIYVDDATTPKLDLTLSKIAYQIGGTPLNVGAGGSTWVCLKYDTTNNIYAFAFMPQLSFDSLLRIRYLNNHASTTVNLSSIVIYETEI
jgi:hypothetical protein